MSRALVLSAALASLQAGCQFELCVDAEALPQETIDEGQSAIIGGSVDAVNEAVVAVLFDKPSGSHALCSGTLVAIDGDRGWVLTAAHCVDGTVTHVYRAVDWRDCTSSGDPAACDGSYTPLTWRAHPAYSTSDYTYDVALIEVAGVPAGTPVIPIAEHDGSVAAGGTIELSGYGQTVPGESGSAPPQYERHHVEAVVSSVETLKIRVDGDTGRTACFGDSGGPALATIAGGKRVVGVASTSDPTCEHSASYSRLSAARDFLGPAIVSPSAPPGSGGAGGGASGSGGSPPIDPGPGGSSAGGAAHGGAAARGGSDAGGDGGDSAAATPESRCVPVSLSCAAGGAPTRAGAGPAWVVAVGLVLARRRRSAAR